eukprot:4769297-Prymnesium_polylepis.1
MVISDWLSPMLQHAPSGGAFFFASFLQTALTFTVYGTCCATSVVEPGVARALSCSPRIVPFDSTTSNQPLSRVHRQRPEFRTICPDVLVQCAAAQCRNVGGRRKLMLVCLSAAEVAPSLLLDAKTPGIEDNNAPSGMQFATLTSWCMITAIYFVHLVVELVCGKDFWR